MSKLFHTLALRYHQRLPERIRQYLLERGIPNRLIHQRLLGWNGARITIPIHNRERGVAFFRLARDPEDESGSPKMLSTFGAYVELYGWEVLAGEPKRVVICEGEFDRLVLESEGFPAVTSTGGALSFRPEWAAHFQGIPEVYLCFDRDEAGVRGAARVAALLPQARVVELPSDVGRGGDVSDFFVRLGRSPEDFEKLLGSAQPMEHAPPPSPRPPARSMTDRWRLERVKAAVPLVDLISQKVILRRSGTHWIGRCPFHGDRTPSLVVFTETATYHCFGCGAHGDALDFLQVTERLSFREALEKLESLFSP